MSSRRQAPSPNPHHHHNTTTNHHDSHSHPSPPPHPPGPAPGMNRFKKRKKEREQEGAKGDLAASTADGDDYMSAAFLGPPPPTSSSSLHKAKTQASAPPPTRAEKAAAAVEKLAEGLTTPLPASNIGLRMLRLMGYKEGQGIGKHADGIVEPLAVVKKTDRAGLGVVERQQEARNKRAEWAEARVELVAQRKEHFQVAMSNRFAEKRVASDLAKAMKAIETLDTRAGRERSCLWWSGAEEEDDEAGDEEGGGSGAREVEPPVPTVPTQEEASAAPCNEEPGPSDEPPSEEELWQTLGNGEKLSVATAYLREAYHYCVYCGHQFADAPELERDCPGESEADH